MSIFPFAGIAHPFEVPELFTALDAFYKNLGEFIFINYPPEYEDILQYFAAVKENTLSSFLNPQNRGDLEEMFGTDIVNSIDEEAIREFLSLGMEYALIMDVDRLIREESFILPPARYVDWMNEIIGRIDNKAGQEVGRQWGRQLGVRIDEAPMKVVIDPTQMGNAIDQDVTLVYFSEKCQKNIASLLFKCRLAHEQTNGPIIYTEAQKQEFELKLEVHINGSFLAIDESDNEPDGENIEYSGGSI